MARSGAQHGSAPASAWDPRRWNTTTATVKAFAAAFSLDRLDGDGDRECSKKADLSQRYYCLYLGVAERVTGISGLVGLARGKQGGRSRFLTAEAPFVDTIFRRPGIICDQAESHSRPADSW
jgi:hypothetical protein